MIHLHTYMHLIYMSHSQFHKTLPKSSFQMHCISVMFMKWAILKALKVQYINSNLKVIIQFI